VSIEREILLLIDSLTNCFSFFQELEFEEFVPELQEFLLRYRETEKTKKEAKAKAKAYGGRA